MSPIMTSQENTVKIRMYRQGLGDCFLLAFHGSDNQPRYMLIDCGVLQGTLNNTAIMNDVVQNIKEATGGHIHILAITHEHWDHISGFYQADKIFKSMTIDRIWMGWTEDPENEAAKELKNDQKAFLQTLQPVFEKMKAFNFHSAGKLEDRLSFYEDLSLSVGKKTSADVMEMVKKLGKEKPVYLKPGGSPHVIEGVPGIRIFIMGPPESAAFIKRSRPKASEVFLKAFLNARESESGEFHHPPFDQRYMIPIADLTSETVNTENTGNIPNTDDTPETGETSQTGETDETGETAQADFDALRHFMKAYYDDEKNSWRTIDGRYAEAAEELALNLEANTNNTSLVMAIEIGETGNILLFTGDAQVGNWQNWDNLSWKIDNKPITSKDILNRTVLYKVGHHGSHNATLREKCLEMTHPDLTAFIPVNEETARKKRWQMPYEKLYTHLLKRCQGRIVRSDRISPKSKPENSTQKKWESFQNSITEDTSLYFEFIVR